MSRGATILETSMLCVAVLSLALSTRLPPGFEISQFSGPELANDIFHLTIDPKGRVVVSGKGYIRILVDDHNVGKANRAIVLGLDQ